MNEGEVDQYVKYLWAKSTTIYEKKGPIRFRRETIILLEFLPWLASLGTFSPITFLSFSLYICLLFMYPYPTSSMELDSKKFFFNLLLFSLKTIGLGSYISNEPSFWLFGWLYFNLLTQILNSIRWRMDSTFIFGRVYLKDELLTFPVPCFQILVLAFFSIKSSTQRKHFFILELCYSA